MGLSEINGAWQTGGKPAGWEKARVGGRGESRRGGPQATSLLPVQPLVGLDSSASPMELLST